MEWLAHLLCIREMPYSNPGSETAILTVVFCGGGTSVFFRLSRQILVYYFRVKPHPSIPFSSLFTDHPLI
jgi:hypothetical protein